MYYGREKNTPTKKMIQHLLSLILTFKCIYQDRYCHEVEINLSTLVVGNPSEQGKNKQHTTQLIICHHFQSFPGSTPINVKQQTI